MITLGKHQIKSQVLLAPMAGISDKPFRIMAKNFGAGLTTSEMVILEQQLFTSNKSKYRLDFTGEKSPISLQIAGTNPNQFSEYAKQADGFGADIIDINMGCPVKKVCKKFAGSALLQDEKLVSDILTKVVRSTKLPVTLKIRTGWDRANNNALNIAKIAQDCGVQMLTIHGRSGADKFLGNAEYDTIKTVVKNIDIPVVANGDIDSGIMAKKVLEWTGASAVMIGRAVEGSPWVVKQIDDYLQTGDWQEFKQKKSIILQHIKDIHAFYPDKMAINIAKKHIRWYLQKLKLSSFWQDIYPMNDIKLQYNSLKNIINNPNSYSDISKVYS